MPDFWLALMLVILFALRLGWLPPLGIGGINYFILPILANTAAGLAGNVRLVRTSLLEVIRSDYISTARSKGLSERVVLFKHAFPNSLIPVVTSIGNTLGAMLGGSLVIETVFSIPGIGQYMVRAITARDYPVVQGSVIFLAFLLGFVMLFVDIVYAYIDPRIKAQYKSRKI
jgi:peptide/nickel transport system permease protein